MATTEFPTLLSDKLLTTKQKIILSFVSLPTNVGWAVSESLIIPYLLIIGTPLYISSWVWMFSPVVSAYIAPKLDKLCDNWSSGNCWSWKGRKKFILILSFISSISMLLLPRSEHIAQFIFRTNSISITFIIAMIIFTIMDISFYLLLRPLQSLIWDITMGNKDIFMETMKIFNIIQGVERMFGLIIVAVCISFNFIFAGTMTHIQSAFTLSALFIFFGTFFALFYSPNSIEITDIDIDIDYNNIDDTFIDEVERERVQSSSIYTTNIFPNPSNKYDSRNITSSEIKYLLDIGQTRYGGDDDDEYDTEEDDDIEIVVGLNSLASNESRYSLYILWLSQLAGWCSMCSVILFWTSFIAIDIYGGGIGINDSFEWLQFKGGLVFGCYGLLLTSLISINCSVLYPWIRQRISLKILYLFGEILMGVTCILFYLTINATFLLILIALFGLTMQIHMQSSHELTENELQSLFKKLNKKSKTKKYCQYFMELVNVIAPITVSLLSGPIVWVFDSQFKYLFLIAGSVQLIFDFAVLLLFSNLLPWKL